MSNSERRAAHEPLPEVFTVFQYPGGRYDTRLQSLRKPRFADAVGTAVAVIVSKRTVSLAVHHDVAYISETQELHRMETAVLRDIRKRYPRHQVKTD